MMIAFGPVPSRRLGRSLGINNIPVLAENLIRPIGTLFAVVNGSGILPIGRGMDWSAVG